MSLAAALAAAVIQGTVWSPSCGVEPGVCTFVRAPAAVVAACRATCVRTRSDRSGRYRLRVAAPGRYRLTAKVQGRFGAWHARPRIVVVRRAGAVVDVDLGKG